MIARLLTTLLGVFLFVYGVIAAVSPLPLGVPLIVLGLLMIAGANPAARPLIRRMRARWRWFDKLVLALARASPEHMKSVIEETTPHAEAAPEAQEKERPVADGADPK